MRGVKLESETADTADTALSTVRPKRVMGEEVGMAVRWRR